jgi:hypothetical protein
MRSLKVIFCSLILCTTVNAEKIYYNNSKVEWNDDWTTFRNKNYRLKERYKQRGMSRSERFKYRAWNEWLKSDKKYNDWRRYKKKLQRVARYQYLEELKAKQKNNQGKVNKERYNKLFNFLGD